VRVVDDEQIGPAAGHGSADARRKVFPTLLRGPSTGRFRVFLEDRLRKHLFVGVGVDQISDLAAKPDGQFGVVGGLNDLELWIPPQKPRRHEVGCEFGLRVTRRHVDDEPLDLAPGHRLELFGNDAVMAALDEVLVDVMHERHKRLLGFFAHFLGPTPFQKLQILLQRLVGQKFKLRHCRYPCGNRVGWSLYKT